MKEYEARISAHAQQNPALKSLAAFMSNGTLHHDCRIESLHFFNRTPAPACTRRLNHDELIAMMQQNAPEEDELQGRILVIEDISASVLETLGSALDIDPFFFASHIDIFLPEIKIRRPSTSFLPSRIYSQNFVNLHYHRILEFASPVFGTTLMRNSNVPRKLRILPQTKGLVLGLARHCSSILKTIGPDGLWLGIILVDSPIDNSYWTKDNIPQSNLNPQILQTKLFLDGYEDHSPLSSPNECAEGVTSLQRRSLLEDLVFSWKRSLPPDFNGFKPTLTSLAHYPLKTVAAEYMSYLEIMFHLSPSYEYSQSAQLPAAEQLAKLKADIVRLQKWSRRGAATLNKLKYIIEFLKLQKAKDEEIVDSQTDTFVIQDYEYIASQVEIHSCRFESLVPVVTSLIQIVDSERSFAETANVTRLTYLALLFGPLTFVSGLFSMNQDLAPGGKIFWMYFVVAMPLCLVTFLVARPPVKSRFQRVFGMWKMKI